MENSERDITVTQEGEVTSLPRSMQIYQAIYNEITGKTEAITDSYNNYLVVELKDLFQLKHLFDQFLEQYHVAAFNSSITIFHIKSSKERFSSFDRLHTYNVNNNSPIERISIELNLLVTPPKLSKPQNYKISVNMVSGAAVVAKNKLNIPDEIPGMIIMRALQDKAVEVKIEYIDYIIARSISELLREWIGSIQALKPSATLKSIQKKSHHFARVSTAAFFVMAVVASVIYAKAFLVSGTSPPALMAQFLLIAGSSILFAKEVGFFLGRNIERKIDSINTNEVSFIHINAGDKKQYKEFQENVESEKWDAWKSGFVALGIGICSSIIAAFIYNAYLT